MKSIFLRDIVDFLTIPNGMWILHRKISRLTSTVVSTKYESENGNSCTEAYQTYYYIHLFWDLFYNESQPKEPLIYTSVIVNPPSYY